MNTDASRILAPRHPPTRGGGGGGIEPLASETFQSVYFPAFGNPQGSPRARLTLLRGRLRDAIVVDLRLTTAIDRGLLATVMQVRRINQSLGGRPVRPSASPPPSWQAARLFQLPSMFATIHEATT